MRGLLTARNQRVLQTVDDDGRWTRPPGKPGEAVELRCGSARNSGNEFVAGEYLCELTRAARDREARSVFLHPVISRIMKT